MDRFLSHYLLLILIAFDSARFVEKTTGATYLQLKSLISRYSLRPSKKQRIFRAKLTIWAILAIATWNTSRASTCGGSGTWHPLYATWEHIVPGILRLKAAGSGALWLIHRHCSYWATDFSHTFHLGCPPQSWYWWSSILVAHLDHGIDDLPSWLSASMMVFIVYNSTPSHLSLCSSIPLLLYPSFQKIKPIPFRPRMASAVPGLAPPPGVMPDFTDPYTLQPYQTLTAVASAIMTTVMVVARLYTVSNVPSYSFPILYQD